MPDNLLILHPADPFAAPDWSSLSAALHEVGFIGDPMPQGGNHFRPGTSFLELITFLGCSPVISLGEPGATAEVCHVEVPEPAPASRFIAGENLKPLRCTGCGFRSTEGFAIGTAWEADPATLWSCPACGKPHSAPALNWRQSAGFGRTFIHYAYKLLKIYASGEPLQVGVTPGIPALRPAGRPTADGMTAPEPDNGRTIPPRSVFQLLLAIRLHARCDTGASLQIPFQSTHATLMPLLQEHRIPHIGRFDILRGRRLHCCRYKTVLGSRTASCLCTHANHPVPKKGTAPMLENASQSSNFYLRNL